MAYTLYEYPGSPVFSFSREQITCVQRGEIAWTEADEWLSYLWPAPIGGISQLPASLPGYEGVVFIDSVEFAPLFEDAEILETSPWNQYEMARYTATWKSKSFNKDDENTPYLTREASVAGEVLKLPDTSLKWDDDSPVRNPEQSAFLSTNTVRRTVTLFQVSSIPWAAIRALVNTVNNSSFEGCAAQTLRFDGANVRQTVYAKSVNWEVSYQFAERCVDGNSTVTWNHVYDTAAGTFRGVKRQNGDPLFALGNFSLLL